MQLIDCPIEGLKIIRLNICSDARGFFVERYHPQKMYDLGIHEHFVQDNHSRSLPNVVRGLHYQHTPPQGKLVSVMRGRVWDVAVDLRKNSPTYTHYHAVELSDENGFVLWIPAGFAHGFCVLGNEPADVLYKTSAAYNPAGERGIRYDDPTFSIDWPVKHPIISERDKGLEYFCE